MQEGTPFKGVSFFFVENPIELFNTFESFSKELQEQFLSSVLSPDASAQQEELDLVASIVAAWKKGDAEEADKLIAVEDDGTAETKELNEKMWIDRDNNMFEKTKAYLADPDKKTYFIVVGAGHMQGENGVITQLKAAGYNVEQVK